jgi:hypothetical protein
MISETWWSEGSIIGLPNNTFLLGFGEPESKNIHQLDSEHPAFYFPDFFLENPLPWIQYKNNTVVTFEEIANFVNYSHPQLHPMNWERLETEPFKSSFLELQNEFSSKCLCKAVPYSFLHAKQSMGRDRLAYSLKNGLDFAKKNRGYLYGFWNSNEGILGVTPELLFQCNDQKLTTMALAGTIRRSEGIEKLINDPKQLREHQWVVEGIKDSLNSLGSVTIGPLGVLELPTLYHLKTSIEAALFTVNAFEDLVQALHPTPALGAFPKQEGGAWLKNYEKKCPRSRFGAPVGVQIRGKSYCAVGIRNMQWNSEKISVGAGCGVIKESQYEGEWNEVLLKLEGIKRCFGW